MIGNDIIDRIAAAAESNWRRAGYLEKLFSAEEQDLIHTSEDQDLMVWLLWSMKESAYKCMYRSTKERLFNPLSLWCSIHTVGHSNCDGTVRSGKKCFWTFTTWTTEHIHSFCVINPAVAKSVKVTISNDRSSLTDLNYRKDSDGIPFLESKAPCAETYLSISHHGRFCSYISTQMEVTGEV